MSSQKDHLQTKVNSIIPNCFCRHSIRNTYFGFHSRKQRTNSCFEFQIWKWNRKGKKFVRNQKSKFCKVLRFLPIKQFLHHQAKSNLTKSSFSIWKVFFLLKRSMLQTQPWSFEGVRMKTSKPAVFNGFI